MPSLQFGLSSYERGRGDLPELPVINMFAEEAPTEDRGVVLQSRSGLSDRSADMGLGPVQQLFKRDLVLSSALFGVSNGKLYSGTTEIGAISGSGFVSMGGYENALFVTAGTTLYYYNGSALASVSFPDSANVAHLAVGASRLLCVRKDTGKFYWSDSLETNIDALDFATAESAPDRLHHILFLDDTAILFGAETIEFWPNTTDDDLPFQPLEGRVIEKGIKATGCAVGIGPTFAWVTNENQICLATEDNVISNPGMEEKIEASIECRLFTFTFGGIEFLALRIDNETHVWSWRSRLWSEFTSYGKDNWIPQCFAGGVFGSFLDGATYEWGDAHTDADVTSNVLERRFRAGFPLNSGGVTVDNVQLRCNVGQTPYLTGDYDDPRVEMRISRDAGQTWGNWKAVSLGSQGNYRTRAQWRACGMASQPGFMAEFRVTDPVPFRASDVLMNEAYGGR